jgi:hypothetical protein
MSAVVVGMLGFVWVARVEAMLPLLAWLAGPGYDADDPAQAELLLGIGQRLGPWMVVGVFCWSFICGALITLQRL